MREKLAAVAHEIWAHWMNYMFSQGSFNDDGSWTMPAEKVNRWARQAATPYDELREEEKPSDREQADKMILVVDEWFEGWNRTGDDGPTEDLPMDTVSEAIDRVVPVGTIEIAVEAQNI